jgi:hypothetical protein
MRRILLAALLTANLFNPLWSLLSSLWTAPANTDAGCGFDPDGRCATAPQPQPDEGCGWDPNGRCNPGS